MRILVVLLLTLVCTCCFKSQTDSSYKAPCFIGGKNAFKNYVNDYMTYPKYEYGTEAGLSAIIYISKQGKIKFVNTLGSNNVEFKKEIKRLLTLMPDWEPAQLNGQPIDTFVIRRFAFSQDFPKFSLDTNIYELNIKWGRSYTEDEMPDSIKQYENNYELRKMEWMPLYKRGVKETIKGNYYIAIDLFKQSREKGNETAVLYYDMSVAYYNLGETLKSCECLREAALRKHETAYNEYINTCR